MAKAETYDTVITINVDVQNDFCSGGRLPAPGGDEVIAPLNRLNHWARQQEGLVVFTRDWHPRATSHFDGWPPHCLQHTAGAAFPDDLEVVKGSEVFHDIAQDLVASKGMEQDEDAYSGFDATVRWQAYTDDLGRSPNQRHGKLEHFLMDYLGGRSMVNGPITWQSQLTGEKYLTQQTRKVRSAAIVIGGLATEYCNKATVLDALKFQEEHSNPYSGKNIGVYALTDAMRAVDINAGDGERALAEMKSAGAILTTSDDIISGRAFQLHRELSHGNS